MFAGFKKTVRSEASEGKTVCFVLMLLYVLLMIPVLCVGRYSVPSADDFSYGAYVRLALSSSDSVIQIAFEVLYAILRRVGISYIDWQGTYSAILLFAIQPTAWSDQAYFIVPYIMSISLTSSVLMFCWQLFYRTFQQITKWQAMSIGIGWMILNILLMPSPVEGLFWYNGAVYYTFFYALMLLLFSMLLMLMRWGRSGKTFGNSLKYKWTFILSCILAFGVAGGNFITGLITAMLDVCFLLYLFVRKRPEERLLRIPAFIFAVGFALCVLAPGNSVRQARFEKLGELEAIWYSLYFAFLSLIENCNPILFAIVLMLLPQMWKAAGRCRSQFRFPALISCFSFCLYAAMYCPPLYATGYWLPGRALNIVQYMYHFIVLFNIWYWLGWLRKHFSQRWLIKERGNWGLFGGRLWRIGSYVLALVLIAIQILWSQTSAHPFTTTGLAVQSLINGEAELYYQENQERFDLLRSADGEVGLKPLSVKPKLLYFDDISIDETYWVNSAYEEFFGVERVYLLSEDRED